MMIYLWDVNGQEVARFGDEAALGESITSMNPTPIFQFRERFFQYSDTDGDTWISYKEAPVISVEKAGIQIQA